MKPRLVIPRLLKSVSPRHRRWQGILDRCTIDPDRLPAPLPNPGPRDFLICGHSRSGTALLTAALWQPPRVVTVMEPWDSFALEPRALFRSLREELSEGRLLRGRLDLHELVERGRVVWQRDGERSYPVAVEPDHLLGVKMPAFWRYLPLLPETKFLVCLRDPVEIVASFARVGGRLGQGLDYDIPFNSAMNQRLEQTRDVAMRRIELFDHVADHLIPYLGHANVHVVRYERWFTDPTVQLAQVADFLGVDLAEPFVKIVRPQGDEPPRWIIEQVQRHCRTAQALGYDLDRWSPSAQASATSEDRA
jgi:hypothetical protein